MSHSRLFQDIHNFITKGKIDLCIKETIEKQAIEMDKKLKEERDLPWI